MGVKSVKLGPKSRFAEQLEGAPAALPDGSPLVAQSDAAMRWVEPAGGPRIGCGCGKALLPSRDAVVDGHRYGLPCVEPERARREGDQPLPSPGIESVFAELRRRIDAREALGVKRYGSTLQTFNGRDVFRDHQEELLDALAYSTQAGLEYAAVVEALIALGRFTRSVEAGRQESRLTQSEEQALALARKLEVALGR